MEKPIINTRADLDALVAAERADAAPQFAIRQLDDKTQSDLYVVKFIEPMANNSEALRDAALAGLGIALLPDFSAQAGLQAGQLVRVLPDWTPVDSFAPQLRAIRPYSAHVPRAVSALVAFLRDRLAPGFGQGL